MRRSVFILCLALLMGASPVFGERHALLIGIKDYPSIPKLFGPVNDARAMRSLLLETYGFKPDRVQLLLDERATKDNILRRLRAYQETTSPGDFIFVFFSGHGTSFYNKDLGEALNKDTGALIPYDFEPDPGNLDQTLAGLLVGRTDLRPVLSRLDQERRLLVVFDACFSGNAVRAVGRQPGVPKNYPLDFSEDYTQETPEQADAVEPYPYQNIIYISASDKHEIAIDLSQGGRYDGKPHGALSDALLMGLSGAADTNQDRILTYLELYRFAKKAAGSMAQTPQLHHNCSVDRPVFDRSMPLDDDSETGVQPGGFSTGRTLRIKCGPGLSPALARRIEQAADLALASNDYDLLLEPANPGPGFSLFLSSGDRLCSLGSQDQVLTALNRYAAAKDLLNLQNPKQSFNVWLSLGESENRSVLFHGQAVGFSVQCEHSADLVLLDIDPQGAVNVLLPWPGTNNRIAARTTLALPEYGRVVPPYGAEFVKVFAFGQAIQGLLPILRQGRITNPREIRELVRAIAARRDWAADTKEVVTFAKQKSTRGLTVF